MTVNNAGLLVGTLDFSSLTGPGSVTLANAGFWQTGGASVFGSSGLGAHSLTNSGEIDTSGVGAAGVTTFDFGAAGASSFANSGLLRVGVVNAAHASLPYAASLTLNHLGAFNNSGTISLSDGAATPDRSLNAPGAVFTGSGSSRLIVDAYLGGPGSVADTLNVGSTAGSTKLAVNDTNPGTGAYNPTGVTVVTTNGANAPGAFTLDPASSHYATIGGQAVLQKGLWLYTLQNQANRSALVSAPNAEALSFTSLGVDVQQLWFVNDPWQERQDLWRDGARREFTEGFDPGVWIKTVGGWSSRTGQATVAPGVTLDTSYNQSGWGLIGGLDADKAVGSSGHDALMGGMSVGYVSSDVTHQAQGDTDAIDGWVLGAYGSYLRGPMFLNASLSGDVLRVRHVAPSLAFAQDVGARSIGARVEAGWRYDLGGGVLEPIGTLAFAHTSVDDFTMPGVVVRPGAQESFRGALGLRYTGVVTTTQNYDLKLSGDLRAWDEFEGHNHTTYITGGPDLVVVDDFHGAFGEVGGTLSLAPHGLGVSGFLEGSIRFKSRYTDSRVSLGARYAW